MPNVAWRDCHLVSSKFCGHEIVLNIREVMRAKLDAGKGAMLVSGQPPLVFHCFYLILFIL